MGKNKKPKQPRRPRKDKGVHKSSVALELTGFSSDMNEKLTKNIIMKSGKVYLSAEGLSEEISENLISTLERKPDVKTDTEGSDVESQFDSKILAIYLIFLFLCVYPSFQKPITKMMK